MIDLWHSVCNSILGRPLEIVVDNRRNHPEFRSSQQEVNTSRPVGYKGKVVLGVWLESFPKLKLLMVTHEIGHSVLKLRGFRGMLRRPRNQDLEGALNSVASHPPLYDLQRSLGHDPQEEVDSRCDHNIRLYSLPGAADKEVSALYLADDLLNCSYRKRPQLKWTLRRKHPDVLRLVERIVSIASDYDLSDSEQNVELRRRLIKEMKLDGAWNELDEAKAIKDLILEVEGRTSR